MEYPIEAIIPEIKQNLSRHNRLVVQAPPGAGKSTVLPLALMNECFLSGKKILMLEPRRLAARSVAERMADTLGEKAGESVGYRIRFESVVSAKTKIEVITEGILSSMLKKDPLLEDVGLLIFDEFHERSIHADLGLTLSLQLQELLREDLKILVMSATLDTVRLTDVLKCPLVISEGRLYPVEVFYKPEDKNESISVNAAHAVVEAAKEFDGDILVFLPGEAEIKRCEEELYGKLSGTLILPLFGSLPLKDQQRAIFPDPAGNRKVVLSTSIAETSLTIEGVRIVIDAGYSRGNRFDPGSGMNKLITVRVSADVADQRAGRAGRLEAGVCIRLWSQLEQQSLHPSRKAEIEESDLSSLLLDLASWGETNIGDYTWVTPPPLNAVNAANDLLEDLHALEDKKITEKGKQMSRLPAHPRISHMLLEAHSGMLPLAIDLAALLEERDPIGKEAGCNIALRADALRRYRSKDRVNANRNALERIDKNARAWARIMNSSVNTQSFDDHSAGALLAYAYPDRIAKRTSGNRYKLSSGKSAFIHENDPLQEEWLCIATLDSGRENPKIWYAAPLEKKDLLTYATKEINTYWDKATEMIMTSEQLKIGSLILESRPSRESSESDRIRILLEVIGESLLRLISKNEKLQQLMARVNSLRHWNPDGSWPDLTTATLKDTIGDWLPPYLTNVRKGADVEKLDLYSIVLNTLSWVQQQALQRLAPEKIEVPTGSMITLEYFPDGSPPVLSVRLQEMFGLFETPAVNNGKTAVLLHLLSPGYKPVQVTQDLNSFWKRTYQEVRKELRMRYPKHHWPEDPFSAQPVRGVKKRI